MACFSDKEISENNIYTAGTLDFSLRSDQDDFEPIILAKNMKPGDVINKDIYVKKEGNLILRYKARSEFINGNCDEDLYNALRLKIWYKYYSRTFSSQSSAERLRRSGAEAEEVTEDMEAEKKTEVITLKKTLRYNGLLQNFNDFGTNSKDPDLWIPNDREYVDNEFYGEDEHWLSFSIGLSEDIPKEALKDLRNKSCEFKFVFDGWQKDPDCEESNGFIDEEEIYLDIKYKKESKEEASEEEVEIPLLDDENEDDSVTDDSDDTKDSGQETRAGDGETPLSDDKGKDEEDLEEEVEIPVLDIEDEDGKIKDEGNEDEKTLEEDVEKEGSETEEDKADDSEDENETKDTNEEDEDAKDEEFVLMPKKGILLDDDDGTDSDEDSDDDVVVTDDGVDSGEEESFEELKLELRSDVKEEIKKINNDNGGWEDDGAENNLNKNSVDCVQAVK